MCFTAVVRVQKNQWYKQASALGALWTKVWVKLNTSVYPGSLTETLSLGCATAETIR